MHAFLVPMVVASAWVGTSPDLDLSEAIDTSGMCIYEVNIRQYTPEGTFDAFRDHIPRLADMGIDILWLMPIHPIGEANRKGTLGSYYAVRDYLDVNPEFGTRQDFRELIDAAHDAGMIVIIDWVANHTAWDHIWTADHPERFTKGPDGGFVPPNPDWADVIDLDFDDPSTRTAIADAMMYWVREFGIDGFRCDVADDVPVDFWAPTIAALRAERPLFMLAEADSAEMHECGFDATYGWRVSDAIVRIAKGEADAAGLRRVVERDAREIGGDGDRFRMVFTTNHDWNSWNGTTAERLGPALDAATVLTFTLPGMPLIYSGQEAGLDKRLEFFEKDPIAWRDDPAAALYGKLCRLKSAAPALRHGAGGGAIEFFEAGDPKRVVAFTRRLGSSEVVVAVNLSAEPTTLRGITSQPGAPYLDLDGKTADPPDRLAPWGWWIGWRWGS